MESDSSMFSGNAGEIRARMKREKSPFTDEVGVAVRQFWHNGVYKAPTPNPSNIERLVEMAYGR